MKRFLAVFACVWMLGMSDASAQAVFAYGGIHPIQPAAGGGFCYTNAPHNHPFPIDPNIAYLYRTHNNLYYFAGNPYHFGYQGQAFPYYGHHPLPDYSSYCYLDGSHFHHFLPPSTYSPYYVVNNGYYYYNGVAPPVYYTHYNMYYRRRHTFWYTPWYRRYHRAYRTHWRTYYRPATITYITRPPQIVYRYTRPPPPRVVTTIRTTVRPAYRYNVYQPRTYPVYHRRPVVQRTTTVVRPGGTVVRRTTTWRRR
jgi:hypothetical protein